MIVYGSCMEEEEGGTEQKFGLGVWPYMIDSQTCQFCYPVNFFPILVVNKAYNHMPLSHL